ncbi:MAG: glucuronate isomerase [Clostridia bacterium]|nr:glucuronate isomerase [Clostridia bacterium]MBR4035036.1 glucuronate isomerase [Clostridia bacterium]
MKAFLDKDFLLTTETSERLYHTYAEGLPIIDYHCHVSPREIWEDHRFQNITEIWLNGDHYKWRLMRSNGVSEHYITGDADPYEKFVKFATLMPKAIGNPMYHWCHLELKNYFGYEGILSAETAKEVWDLCEKRLAEEHMSVRGIITASNVAFIGTTDDPTDSLEYHKLLKADDSFKTVVAPSFRPDKALNIDKAGWKDYIARLSEVSGVGICDLDSLKRALSLRIAYFAEVGCRASDHGLDAMVYAEASDCEINKLIARGLAGETVTADEAEALKTALLVHCAAEYVRHGFVMQLHYNCMRNPNSRAFATLGPDSGFDCIGPSNGSRKLAALLDRLNAENSLPKTIIYSLDPSDNQVIDTIIGAFQGSEAEGKIQHGSGWWFNDNKVGMRDQMTSLANLSLLGNFVGMLTDSRSFLSYTRHEYFRRILCGLIGEWVENGEYPDDDAALSQIVEGICYYNAKKYFGI